MMFAESAAVMTKPTQSFSMYKIKVLCLSLWYPLSISRYFEKALRHNPNLDVKTAGVYTAEWIPWMGGMTVDKKYAIPPDIILPFPPSIQKINYETVQAQLGDWIPDIVLCIDAGISWKYKPTHGIVAHIATDPHVLDYDHQRSISDKFFNMQLCYSKAGDIYLPYAYSIYDHYPNPILASSTDLRGYKEPEKDTDCVLIGMPYEQRTQWINQLRAKGLSVIFENGPIFDEARVAYNRGRIGLNWSSLNDLNARAFEIPAMRLAPVMNVVSDASRFFDAGVHYKSFTGLQEATEAVMWLKDHPEECQKMAEDAYKNVQGQTYDARIDLLLEECGF